jgi:hypothetical protein
LETKYDLLPPQPGTTSSAARANPNFADLRNMSEV